MGFNVKVKAETREFNRYLKKFIKKSDVSVEKVIKRQALELLKHIVAPEPNSTHPVDTGQARAGWFASMEGLGLKGIDLNERVNQRNVIEGKRDVATGKKQGDFKNKLRNKKYKYVELINGVKHIIYLEYGHSDQAPVGMVRISMRKMRGKMPPDLSREFVKDWNKIGF